MPKKTVQNRIVYDHELILRLQRGDNWVFHLLIRRFCERVFSIAFGISLDAEVSQRVTEEVFLQVDQTIGEIKSDAPIAAWLQRIAVERCLTWPRRWARWFNWRRDARERPKSHPSSSDPSRQWIEGALKRLPDSNRAFFALNVLEGMKRREIAQLAGISSESVQHRLDHARRQLMAMAPPLTRTDENTDAATCTNTGETICRYLDDDMEDADKAQFESHLGACQDCRSQVQNLASIAAGIRDQVKIAADQVDFTALEKAVLHTAREQRLPRKGAMTLKGVVKYAIPAAVIAGLLALFVF